MSELLSLQLSAIMRKKKNNEREREKRRERKNDNFFLNFTKFLFYRDNLHILLRERFLFKFFFIFFDGQMRGECSLYKKKK